MSHSDALLTLIDAIHAAGLEPERWPAVASDLAAHFGARVAGMFVYHPGDPRWNFSTNVGIDPAWMRRFQGDFTVNENPCEQAFRERLAGSVAADWMLVPTPTLAKTRLVNEWAAPQGLRAAVLVKTAMDDGGIGLLSMIRPATASDWAVHDIERLEVLARHLVRAVAVSRRVGVLQGQLDVARALLDTSAAPMLVVESDGRLVYTNAAAKALLDRRDGLAVQHGAITAARSDQAARLRALIGAAAAHSHERGGRIALSRPSGGQPLSVLVAPAGPQVAAPISLEERVVLFVDDPDARAMTTHSLLRGTYGLTRAEAALVESLLDGARSLRDAADRLGITLNTAKTHLRRVFEKTGTHRQSELIKLVLTMSS